MGGTLVRIVALRGATADLVRSRLDSLRTWWILAVVMALAVLFGPAGIAALLAIAGVLSLREFIALIGRDMTGRFTAIVIFAIVPLYYVTAVWGSHELVRQVTPVVFLVILGALRASLGLVPGYIRTTASMFWGLMLFVYGLSHAFFLMEVATDVEPCVGQVGWFIFLTLLTETNDIMQAITGRRFGKTKITPRVSPNKSMEGLLGGMAATVTLAIFTAPCLTTLTAGRSLTTGIGISVASGLLISLFGFLGDINMSAVKRDAGVKDGSRLLPGQGGMIDRIDSLTFTAPVFYYFVRFVI